MTREVESAVTTVTEIVRTWPNVEAVTLVQGEEDVYDPYFFLSFDVFLEGGPPELDERVKAFENVGAFEAAPVSRKDRFLVEWIPIRIEYHDVSDTGGVVHGLMNGQASPLESGTYPLFRIVNSRIVIRNSDWIEQIRNALAEPAEEFWNAIVRAEMAKMEHAMSDLGAAAFREDDLFFLASQAKFVRALCSTLFAANRRLEPSERFLGEETPALPFVPEGFPGRFDFLLRRDGDIRMGQIFEVAEILTKGVFALLPEQAPGSSYRP